ncbi:hypothetical protein BT69DRAFT_1318298 [Atractiella rhizophila]|nr:hypothetical protein BT69DRAFT_1318298 [Atractiella rhizophila]
MAGSGQSKVWMVPILLGTFGSWILFGLLLLQGVVASRACKSATFHIVILSLLFLQTVQSGSELSGLVRFLCQLSDAPASFGTFEPEGALVSILRHIFQLQCQSFLLWRAFTSFRKLARREWSAKRWKKVGGFVVFATVGLVALVGALVGMVNTFLLYTGKDPRVINRLIYVSLGLGSMADVLICAIITLGLFRFSKQNKWTLEAVFALFLKNGLVVTLFHLATLLVWAFDWPWMYLPVLPLSKLYTITFFSFFFTLPSRSKDVEADEEKSAVANEPGHEVHRVQFADMILRYQYEPWKVDQPPSPTKYFVNQSPLKGDQPAIKIPNHSPPPSNGCEEGTTKVDSSHSSIHVNSTSSIRGSSNVPTPLLLKTERLSSDSSSSSTVVSHSPKRFHSISGRMSMESSREESTEDIETLESNESLEDTPSHEGGLSVIEEESDERSGCLSTIEEMSEESRLENFLDRQRSLP